MIEGSENSGEQLTNQTEGSQSKALATDLQSMVDGRNVEPPLRVEVSVFKQGQSNLLRKEGYAAEIAKDAVVHLETGYRDQLLEQFPSVEEGLNLDRVRTFMTDAGLPTASFTVIEKTQARAMEAELHKAGLPGEFDMVEGFSVPMMGLGYVIRNDKLEANNGAAITESLLVHELAHLTGTSQLQAVDRDGNLGVDSRRRGFVVMVEADHTQERGVFFEEGFAELVRQRYMKEALGKDGGFGPEQATTVDVPRKDGSILIEQLPSSYLNKNDANEWSFMAPATAGAALEMLAELDPDILPLMYKARTDTDAYRDFIQAVNAIEPGLYSYLGKLGYSDEDFCEGYRHIQRLVRAQKPDK